MPNYPIFILFSSAQLYCAALYRVLNLCVKYCHGVIPDTKHDPAFALPFDLDAVVRMIDIFTFPNLPALIAIIAFKCHCILINYY